MLAPPKLTSASHLKVTGLPKINPKDVSGLGPVQNGSFDGLGPWVLTAHRTDTNESFSFWLTQHFVVIHAKNKPIGKAYQKSVLSTDIWLRQAKGHRRSGLAWPTKDLTKQLALQKGRLTFTGIRDELSKNFQMSKSPLASIQPFKPKPVPRSTLVKHTKTVYKTFDVLRDSRSSNTTVFKASHARSFWACPFQDKDSGFYELYTRESFNSTSTGGGQNCALVLVTAERAIDSLRG